MTYEGYADKKKRKEYLKEYMRDWREHKAEIKEAVQNQIKEMVQVYKPLEEFWNEKIKQAHMGLTETKTSQCPYCLKEFKAPAPLNDWGMAMHLFEYHREKFTPFFYEMWRRTMDHYETAERWVKNLAMTNTSIKILESDLAASMNLNRELFTLLEQMGKNFDASATYLKNLETTIENLESHVKGQFKGHHKPLKETAPSYNDGWTRPKKEKER